ncbi:methenyltetrahydrofolate cyclohydrolase Fcha [Thermacetogenium phaeum DSM 12270]|uniref:Methenyltetrahydrofolate cyclohydrolase Fcha n=1 Tax=Thermacetogenium phaeum (strain ATCC BAA-254 / DSM 26808 / PB) TaxID=1089553 RepID=K4LJK7_THEPS|nr:cyclodeaminase/cyclohydrolase family protein [Thermacetogenium phaeum]AFV12237.1 methenyltetrahydrofolate cyclohydrolase Fcha [Thermacetogenium phaeum DSM 12270]MDK2880385.1 methenyltetrahydrofolate cyclohydrolase [Clostridia bacterium]
MNVLMDLTVKDFLAELASASPAPGGGSVSALAGALGAALVSMVARLSDGGDGSDEKEKEDLRRLLERSLALMESLSSGVDGDTEAFNRVMSAYRMPKETPEEKERRSRAIQKALQEAADHPLRMARECLDVLRIAGEMVRRGNPNALSDAGVAALIAYAGMVGSLFNVAINLEGIKDQEFRRRLGAEKEILMGEAAGIFAEIKNLLKTRLL